MMKIVPRVLVKILWVSLLSLLLVGLMDVRVAWAQQLVWTRQFGTSANDWAFGVSVYGSGVYVVGTTGGALPGQTSKGGTDAFVRKYDAYGNLKWTRQFGTSSDDGAWGVSVDSSGVYVVGGTLGAFSGQTRKGGGDAFVRKYDFYGNVKWTRQFGSSSFDSAKGVSVYSSGVYVAGMMGGNAFVRKYDVYGNVKWTRQFGSYSANGVSVGSSGVYVAGETIGDAFVRKYDFYGNLKWTRQFGAPPEASGVVSAHGVFVASSGVYVVGEITNSAFVRKYDVYGNLKWARQFGPTWGGCGNGVSVYGSGVYVAGCTIADYIVAFVSKFDVYGNLKWTDKFGTATENHAFGVSVGSSGVYVAGYTGGALPGQTNKGNEDAFLRKYALT